MLNNVTTPFFFSFGRAAQLVGFGICFLTRDWTQPPTVETQSPNQ